MNSLLVKNHQVRLSSLVRNPLKKNRPDQQDLQERETNNLCVIVLIIDSIKRCLCLFKLQNSQF